jgi:hypothetical protein
MRWRRELPKKIIDSNGIPFGCVDVVIGELSLVEMAGIEKIIINDYKDYHYCCQLGRLLLKIHYLD